MAEYDLICDVCHAIVTPAVAIVSWVADAGGERGFALTHPQHVPETATQRAEVRLLVGPNEYLRFVSERLGRAIADPEPLRAIVWGLAPFVMRPDSTAEMDSLRAASFGERPGVKPGTTPIGGTTTKTTQVAGGK